MEKLNGEVEPCDSKAMARFCPHSSLFPLIAPTQYVWLWYNRMAMTIDRVEAYYRTLGMAIVTPRTHSVFSKSTAPCHLDTDCFCSYSGMKKARLWS